MICVRISQKIANAPIVEADAPIFDHGETEEKPSPVPNDSRISARAADTNAPPITAAQETPDEFESFVNGRSVTDVLVSTDSGTLACCMRTPYLLIQFTSVKLHHLGA